MHVFEFGCTKGCGYPDDVCIATLCVVCQMLFGTFCTAFFVSQLILLCLLSGQLCDNVLVCLRQVAVIVY